jgi:hypothetical protein
MLARTDIRLPSSSGHLYRGIDRLPFVPDPLTNARDRGTSVWNQYLGAWEDALLPRELKIARRTGQQLQDLGVAVEVVRAGGGDFPHGIPLDRRH